MRCWRTSKFREDCLSHLSVSSTSKNPEVISLNFDKQVGLERDGTCVCACVCVCVCVLCLSCLIILRTLGLLGTKVFLINESLFYYTSFKTVTKTILFSLMYSAKHFGYLYIADTLFFLKKD